MAEIWLEMVVKRQFVSLLLFVTPSMSESVLLGFINLKFPDRISQIFVLSKGV